MLKRDPQKWYPHDYLLRYTILPFIPKFVTPNALTLFRLFMVPVVFWFLYTQRYEVGIPLFMAVAFTDALDGSIARVRKKITEWGTFYDPFADKLLIGSVALLLITRYFGIFPALVVVTIEVTIILGGFFRRRKGLIISANIYGKIKMLLQVFGIFFLLMAAWLEMPLFLVIAAIALIMATVLAVVSILTYSI